MYHSGILNVKFSRQDNNPIIEPMPSPSWKPCVIVSLSQNFVILGPVLAERWDCR